MEMSTPGAAVALTAFGRMEMVVLILMVFTGKLIYIYLLASMPACSLIGLTTIIDSMRRTHSLTDT